jgi:hypothetical protein
VAEVPIYLTIKMHGTLQCRIIMADKTHVPSAMKRPKDASGNEAEGKECLLGLDVLIEIFLGDFQQERFSKRVGAIRAIDQIFNLL